MSWAGDLVNHAVLPDIRREADPDAAEALGVAAVDIVRLVRGLAQREQAEGACIGSRMCAQTTGSCCSQSQMCGLSCWLVMQTQLLKLTSLLFKLDDCARRHDCGRSELCA